MTGRKEGDIKNMGVCVKKAEPGEHWIWEKAIEDEYPHGGNEFEWVFAFKARYKGGESRFCRWVIAGFGRFDLRQVREAFRRRCVKEGIVFVKMFKQSPPPDRETAEMIRKINSERDFEMVTENSDATRIEVVEKYQPHKFASRRFIIRFDRLDHPNDIMARIAKDTVLPKLREEHPLDSHRQVSSISVELISQLVFEMEVTYGRVC